MARIVVFVLLLSLVFAPVADAGGTLSRRIPRDRVAGSMRSAFDWLFSWLPAIRAASKKSAALIVPDGLTAAPPVPRSGGLILPDGVRRPGRLSR